MRTDSARSEVLVNDSACLPPEPNAGSSRPPDGVGRASRASGRGGEGGGGGGVWRGRGGGGEGGGGGGRGGGGGAGGDEGAEPVGELHGRSPLGGGLRYKGGTTAGAQAGRPGRARGTPREGGRWAAGF